MGRLCQMIACLTVRHGGLVVRKGNQNQCRNYDDIDDGGGLLGFAQRGMATERRRDLQMPTWDVSWVFCARS